MASNPTTAEIVKVSRRAQHEAYVAALRDGRKQRAHTFTPKKGKGSYRRTPKHRNG